MKTCSYDFSHCSSIHHPSFVETIFALVPLSLFFKEVHVVRKFASKSVYNNIRMHVQCTHMYMYMVSIACMYAIIHTRTLTQSRVEFVQCQNGVVRSVLMLVDVLC